MRKLIAFRLNGKSRAVTDAVEQLELSEAMERMEQLKRARKFKRLERFEPLERLERVNFSVQAHWPPLAR